MGRIDEILKKVDKAQNAIDREKKDLPVLEQTRTVRNLSSLSNASARVVFLASVISDSTGKGHYVCKLVNLDATDWDSNNDMFDDIDVKITGSSNISFNENTPNADTIVMVVGDGDDGFITKGFIPGMKAGITSTSSNNKTVQIDTVTQTTITIVSGDDLTDEADTSAVINGQLVVLNLPEYNTTTHNALVPGDMIECWNYTDDEGTTRLVGKSIEQDVRPAFTQEIAQSNLLISVKLLDRTNTPVGTPFDATFLAPDNVTAANAALPRVAASETILVMKTNTGVWIVVHPTITKSSVCA